MTLPADICQLDLQIKELLFRASGDTMLEDGFTNHTISFTTDEGYEGKEGYWRFDDGGITIENLGFPYVDTVIIENAENLQKPPGPMIVTWVDDETGDVCEIPLNEVGHTAIITRPKPYDAGTPNSGINLAAVGAEVECLAHIVFVGRQSE